MIEEVSYKGFTAAESDYIATDGELSAMCNLVPDKTGLSVVQNERTIMRLPQGHDVLFVHNGSRFTNYIVRCENNDIAFTQDGKQFHPIDNIPKEELNQITAIGNTLLVLTTNGTIHFLWKQNELTYKHLGKELPDIDISFGLQGELKRGEQLTATLDYFENPHGGSWSVFDIGAEFSGKVREDKKQELNNIVLAKVNKFIAEHYQKKGKFIYPFFVRYALRLYDGSLTKHSAPILMLPSTKCSPMCIEDSLHLVKKKDKLIVINTNTTWRIIGMVCDLDYQLQTDLSAFNNWKDIVKGVDLFVSAPIYTYKQAGEIEGVSIRPDVQSNLSNNISVCKLKDKEDYGCYDWLTTYNSLYDPASINASRINAVIELPSVPEKAVVENIKTCSDFYLLKRFDLTELNATTERKVIPIEEDYFRSLVNREHLTDDYDSHDKITAKRSVIYNQRVNYTNLTKTLFKGFNPTVINAFDKGVNKTVKIRPFIYINQDNREIVIDSGEYNIDITLPIYYFYYPNANARKAVFQIKGLFDPQLSYFFKDKVYYKEVNLESHIALNGAFWFGSFATLYSIPTSNSSTAPTLSTKDRTIEIKNKIYTSAVNNPFIFPVLGITSVGVGEVLGIASAAKALSEGQFGQFPLYAFTSDGVWALEVAANGSYHATQPITRDVCVDTDGITQIDHAVLFPTSRGIMLLQGSDSMCITDVLYSDNVFKLASLPKGKDIIKLAGLSNENFDYIRFEEYIKDSGMIYDYAHQRIILYNPTKRYAYIYSLKTKLWGMMQSNITHGVNSYPEALAMTTDNRLVDFTNYTKVQIILNGNEINLPTGTLLCTRPLKLGGKDNLKTITSVIQRGAFPRGAVKTILYGSNDLNTWQLVWSSKSEYLRGFSGSPYKYYRIVSIGNLTSQTTLSGASIDLKPRFNNQLR